MDLEPIRVMDLLEPPTGDGDQHWDAEKSPHVNLNLVFRVV